MPELPEVETMRRGILPIVGSRIEGVLAARLSKRPILIAPRLPVLRRRVVGRTIRGIERVGKRVVVRLDADLALVFEPRMTGLVLLTAPPTLDHLRLTLRLSGGPHGELLFWDRRGLGLVRLVTPEEFATLYGGDRIGPDALAVSGDQLRARLAKSRREIKVALIGSARAGRRGESVCQRDFAPGRYSPAAPLRPVVARRLAAAARGAGRGARTGHSFRRFDVGGWHVPQRAEPAGRVSKSSPRLRPCRRHLRAMRAGGDPANRPGPTGHVLLCLLPAASARRGGQETGRRPRSPARQGVRRGAAPRDKPRG